MTFIKGRGAPSNLPGRFESVLHEAEDDGWTNDEVTRERPSTSVRVEQAKSILTRNDSPDIPFELSLNPYRGCEHGCVYCYARPSHACLDLSPGLDFETRLVAKPNAADLLKAALSKSAYRPSPIALGSNTDIYQPIEREWRITREIIEVLAEARHPFSFVTKSALVERDLDLLAPLAELGLVHAFVSIGTLDRELARKLEPRAAAPQRRLEVIRNLSQAGIPAGVMVAPVIPALTDKDIEKVLEAAANVGARSAGYVFLRLPHELKALFSQWLETHYPLKAGHVMSLVRQSRGGRENDPRFGSRMVGSGQFAALIAQRFRVAQQRFGLDQGLPPHRLDLFRPPGKQESLF
ncbi:MAG: PA0069 family radical SAM protein [Thiobacillaceae bacterium]